MNKTKKELYEENKKYKEIVDFWLGITEKDELNKMHELAEKNIKTLLNIKKIVTLIVIILLLATFFILGLIW